MKADVLNLYQLKVFQLVAQKKLIREVANELQVTASAVSQSLAKLEQDLGTELFVHDVRPLRLTPAGQALLKGAPVLLESADLLRRSVTDHSLADISLRLGMSESVTSTISPLAHQLLKALRSGIGLREFSHQALGGTSPKRSDQRRRSPRTPAFRRPVGAQRPLRRRLFARSRQKRSGFLGK